MGHGSGKQRNDKQKYMYIYSNYETNRSVWENKREYTRIFEDYENRRLKGLFVFVSWASPTQTLKIVVMFV